MREEMFLHRFRLLLRPDGNGLATLECVGDRIGQQRKVLMGARQKFV